MRRLLLIFFFVVLAFGATAYASTVVRVSEVSLRKAAMKAVMPGFPEEAVRQNARGIAVVEVVVDEYGNVSRASVVESPHPLIADAVVSAVQQWKFRVSSLKGKPTSVRSKLTFYYVIDERGVGRVENPRRVERAVAPATGR